MPFLRRKSSLLGRRHSVSTDTTNTGKHHTFLSVPDEVEVPGGNPSTAAVEVEDPAHRSSYGISDSINRSTSLTVAMMEDPSSFSNSFTTKTVPEEDSSSSPAAATTATLPNPRWEHAPSSSSVSSASSSSSSIRIPTVPRRRSCLKSPNTAFTSEGPSRRPLLQPPRSSIRVYVTGKKHKITRGRHIGIHDDVDVVLIPSLLEVALEHDQQTRRIAKNPEHHNTSRETNDDDRKNTKKEQNKTIFRRSSSFFQRQQLKRQRKQHKALQAQQLREELWCSPQEYESMGIETENLICLVAGLGDEFRTAEQLHAQDEAFTSQYCTRGLESQISFVQQQATSDPLAFSNVMLCPKEKSKRLVHALRTTQREQQRRKTYNADELAHLCQTQTRRDIAVAYQRARR